MKQLKMAQDKSNQPYYIQSYGTNLLYYKNPRMVAWWSAAFPGFGHILLGQYIKGFVLFLWEMVINQGAHLNLGLVATLQGEFDKTKGILDPVWILLYIPIYLFVMWDSYHVAKDNNQLVEQPLKHFATLKTFSIGVTGYTIFTKKSPGLALFWSLFSPGAGQFYLHRLLEAIYFMIWFIAICYYSHFFEGLLYLLEGNLALSNKVFNIQWFMYLPSLFFFAAYNAYSDAVETNIIYTMNQTQKLKQKYQNPTFKVDFPRSK